MFIASIDEAMSHFEFRSEYSFQCGASLAKVLDKHLSQVISLAARASATVTGANGGTQIVNATAGTNADSLIASIASAAQALDEKDVPKEDRTIWVKPAQYYMLLNSGSLAIHRDYNPEGNGSIRSGVIMQLFGMDIVQTNHMVTTDLSADSGTPVAYRGNFSTTVAQVAQRGAVGTVKLLDLGLESEYLTMYQGTLVVAKQAVGHGILRPECAVEIVSA